MIIRRELVKFGDLIMNDPEAKELFMKVFNDSYSFMDEERKQDWYNQLMDECLDDKDMGWCMHGIGDLVNGFRKLDSEKPYDNGYNYSHVNHTEIVWCDENSIILRLIHSSKDEYYIVGEVILGNAE